MSLKIALVTAELYPFAKVGGLGDVASALSKELARAGHEITVFLPRYSGITAERFPELTAELKGEVEVPLGGRVETARLFVGMIPRSEVRLVLIDHDGFFARPHPYTDPTTGKDYADNQERYIFFCKAVLASWKALDLSPDVVHLNDFQTALIAPLLRESLADDPRYATVGTLFSIHNMGYQGVFATDAMRFTGLPNSLSQPMGALEYYGHLNFMKAGLAYADKISTVSERYADEIQSSAEFGSGLEGVLAGRRADLIGILNGIDTEVWDPAHDRVLPFHYDATDLGGKAANKVRLLETMELPVEPEVPVFGIISRLVSQKGFDLIEQIAGDLMGHRLKLVVLGTGEPRFEELMRRLRNSYPQKFALSVEFNDPLAHLIEAGSDCFLMPSRYEPCGLNQMYSLRYGTIPVVRKTGGLADTVTDFNPDTGKGNGFVFEEYSGHALLGAIERALSTYEHKRVWKKLVQEAMSIDHSWARAAKKYAELYAVIRAKRRD